MKLSQLSVFIENRSGRIARITSLLGEKGVNIRAMSLADTSDFGILRLIVNEPETARQALKENGFTVGVNEVLAVRIPDAPGELGKVLGIIEQAGLNVEYMYAFVQKSAEFAVIIFRFDDLDQAAELLGQSGVAILPREEVLAL